MWPDKLRAAGFVVECYAEHFKDHEGKPEKKVKDPAIIKHCQKSSFVLVTTDKQLCYTHAATVKKTEIIVVATESNRAGIGIWVDALIKAKPKIERLVKKAARPCCFRLSRTGTLTADENLMNRETRRTRPHEGQDEKD